ncbi:MAG: membrane protein insertion efficiency factor YidD [Candidatus Eisenbacteria bacterium]
MGRVEQGLVAVAAGAIGIYQIALSPVLPRACRFGPTCSDYALEALKRHGVVRGTILAIRRVLRCHPLGGSGLDPVP